MEREPADVERPQVERRMAVEDPLRHHPAGAPAGGDAVEEPGGDVEVVELGRSAHHEVGVGGVGDRAVDQRADAGALDHRRALGGERRQLLEPVEVRIEQPTLERRRDAVLAERERVRFVAADQEPLSVGLVVHEMIRVTQCRHATRHVLDRSGEDVLVLDGDRRDTGADHAPDRQAPHPAGVDHDLAFDVAAAALRVNGMDGGRPPSIDRDRVDPGVLDDSCATPTSATGERLGDARRVDVPVGREERRRHDVFGRHQREQLLGS